MKLQVNEERLTCANCNNEQWVCEDHPEVPFNSGDKECCGGAGMMCKCHPNYESDQLMKDLGDT